MAKTPKELADAFAKEDDRALAAAVKLLLSQPHGRKYLWRLLEWGKVGAQPFNLDPNLTAFACGELNVGQQILSHMLSIDPMSYGTMQKEQVDEHTRRTNQLTLAGTDPAERPDPEFDL